MSRADIRRELRGYHPADLRTMEVEARETAAQAWRAIRPALLADDDDERARRRCHELLDIAIDTDLRAMAISDEYADKATGRYQ
jgi:hypothetical protein